MRVESFSLEPCYLLQGWSIPDVRPPVGWLSDGPVPYPVVGRRLCVGLRSSPPSPTGQFVKPLGPLISVPLNRST